MWIKNIGVPKIDVSFLVRCLLDTILLLLAVDFCAKILFCSPNLTKMKETPSYLRSETLRLIQESEQAKDESSRIRSVQAPSTRDGNSSPVPSIFDFSLALHRQTFQQFNVAFLHSYFSSSFHEIYGGALEIKEGRIFLH